MQCSLEDRKVSLGVSHLADKMIRHSGQSPIGALTVDVEDWFHILDTPAAPAVDQWSSLESRVEQNVDRILQFLSEQDVRATMFWLGWVAERHPHLVRKCVDEGHELASHGYAHVLAYQVGRQAFREDIRRGKAILEDLSGVPVSGFRAAGFGITDDAKWAFDEIVDAGYRYDSSVFPCPRGHGGMHIPSLGPHEIDTSSGKLVEFPMSMVETLGRRINMFGGGYLRLSPLGLIRWGVRQLQKSGQPVIVYIHPREVDPDHPRLPLSLVRRFKSYVGLKTTLPKLRWLCSELDTRTMGQLADAYVSEQQVLQSPLQTA